MLKLDQRFCKPKNPPRRIVGRAIEVLSVTEKNFLIAMAYLEDGEKQTRQGHRAGDHHDKQSLGANRRLCDRLRLQAQAQDRDKRRKECKQQRAENEKKTGETDRHPDWMPGDEALKPVLNPPFTDHVSKPPSDPNRCRTAVP